MKSQDSFIDPNVLTEEEVNFCLLYVNAPAPLAGNATECYCKVYGGEDGDALSKSKAAWAAKKLLEREVVKQKIEELRTVNLYDSASLKQRITTTMLKVMDECADGQYKDRYGKLLSPAAMRSVAVSAAKLVADVNGIKEDTIQQIQIGAENGSGITFNLIVPNQKKVEETL